MKSIEVAAAAAAVSMLCACGGGGGGGGSTIREVPFTSFSAIVPNQTVVMTGISAGASGSISVGPFGDITVTDINLDPIDENNSTARLTYDTFGNLSGLSFSTPHSSASFRANEIDCSVPPTCAALNAAETSLAVAVDATAVVPAWNYQSYGVWLNQTSPSTFQAGAMSAGAVTPGSAIPTMGSGFFNGAANGFYVDSMGTPHSTGAFMQATADFQNRSIGFLTTGTQIISLNDPTATPINSPLLDLSGTLTYDAGVNRFSGTVTTTSPVLTGPATGRFYGPAAQEIGGVYSLTGGGLMRMFGAFGGRQ